MPKFKLAIADTIGVLVKGAYMDENAAEKEFSFTLFCVRLANEELRQLSEKYPTAFEFLRAHARGWKDQTLVVDEANQPAPFSPDALEVLLNMGGMASLCYSAYRAQVTVTAKN
ncbi:hypothetical protein [Ramlibacter sp. Leaf400]|uniref:hypothetical protein n=1 Tax=Ramlibacter sp. Leaf400 TaxID=1736365 RepID=UPI0006F37A05|nr:hypothetical protein [Ramlibacter sp. Leaf400]KQT10964.1 hypothetical protein ASG30_09200 [Ramlibacter sp. Leaf400]